MFPATKPRPSVSAASLTSNVDAETVITTRLVVPNPGGAANPLNTVAPDLGSIATMKVCRVCLAMDEQMYNMSEQKLTVIFEKVTGVEIKAEDKLPTMLCWECVVRLLSANKFVEKALRTDLILMSKIEGSGFITKSDIESIDRAQYQLESTLGFKFYEENDPSFYTIKECDVINQSQERKDECSTMLQNQRSDALPHCKELTVVSEDIMLSTSKHNVPDSYKQLEDNCNSAKPNDFKYTQTNSEDIIETPKFVNPRLDNVNINNVGIESPAFDLKTCTVCTSCNQGTMKNVDKNKFQITECQSETLEITINIANEFFIDEILLVDETVKVCLVIKQNRKTEHEYLTTLKNQSEALPHCKELRVVSEDIMLSTSKHNVPDTYKQLQDNCKSAKPNECLQLINKNRLFMDKNDFKDTLTNSEDIIKTPKFINPGLNNVNIINAGNASPAINLKNCTAKGNISYTHNDAESSKNLFICDICDESFQIKTELIQHIQGHLYLYNCTYCSYKTSLRKVLEQHINCKHTKSISFKCTHCSYVTFRKSCLKEHIKQHTEDTSYYYCALCSYKTNYERVLQQHIKCKHTKSITFKCAHCSYVTFKKSYLKDHIIKQHTEDKIYYYCTQCSYKTNYERVLKQHIKCKHTKSITFKCAHCSYVTFKKSYLKKHIKQHTEDKIYYYCTQCSYKAKHNYVLKQHINCKHTKSISFNCAHCSYVTFRKSYLKVHIIKQHTEDTSYYYCTHCSYKTKYKRVLQQHINCKHTKSISFNCTHCSYVTFRKSCLKLHIKQHTGDASYSYCAHCSYKTCRKYNLSKHIITKHTKEMFFNCSSFSFKTHGQEKLRHHVKTNHQEQISKKTIN